MAFRLVLRHLHILLYYSFSGLGNHQDLLTCPFNALHLHPQPLIHENLHGNLRLQEIRNAIFHSIC